MTSSMDPKRLRAALEVARAATLLTNEQPLADHALELALGMGVDIDTCAHLYASLGSRLLLEACLDQGALPTSIRPPLDADRISPAQASALSQGVTPMARALLVGSDECCLTLASRGADMLRDPSCIAAVSCVTDDGVSRWAAVLAGLSTCSPHPSSATDLARALAPMAARAFRQNRTDGAALPRQALAAMDRLAELGADFGSSRPTASNEDAEPKSRDALEPQSLGAWLCSKSMEHLSRPEDNPGKSEAVDELCAFLARRDPAGRVFHFMAAMSALSKAPRGDHSAMPEPGYAEALRRACTQFAQRCPAGMLLMQMLIDEIDTKSLQPKDLRLSSLATTIAGRGSRRSLMFLRDSAFSWPLLEGELFDYAGKLMAACLKLSAGTWALSEYGAKLGSASQESWLAWARTDNPQAVPEAGSAGWLLMAAKLCTLGDPRLAEAFDRMAPSASALANPDIAKSGQERIDALMLAVDLALLSPNAPSTKPSMRL